jgi:hypothetical protein
MSISSPGITISVSNPPYTSLKDDGLKEICRWRHPRVVGLGMTEEMTLTSTTWQGNSYALVECRI